MFLFLDSPPPPPINKVIKNGILVPRGFLSLNIFKCLKKMRTSPIPYFKKSFENRRQETCFANTPSRDSSNHLQCHILRRVSRICAHRHATSPSGVQIFGLMTSVLFLYAIFWVKIWGPNWESARPITQPRHLVWIRHWLAHLTPTGTQANSLEPSPFSTLSCSLHLIW